MKFGQAIDSVLFKNYFNLEGKASRSEYWWFMLFFIILFSGFVEWWNYTFNHGYHQQGWHFTGAIILTFIIIPLSFLVTVFIALFKKLSFIKLETSNIKLFFWISILLFAVLGVIPFLIFEIIELDSV